MVTLTHTLAFVGVQETFYGPDLWLAECTCHNPDGNGDGRVDFTGNTYEEAIELLNEHIEEEK